MGTAANPILRYQYRKSMTNGQIILKTCELAYAESEDLHKPPRQRKAELSAFVHSPGGPNSPMGKHSLGSELKSCHACQRGRADRVLQKHQGNFLGTEFLLSNQAAMPGDVI